MNKNNFWKGFVVVCILIGAAYFLHTKYLVQAEIKLNQIEVQDLNGEDVDMEQYSGKPLVVNFWASWCPPCIKELPEFEEVKQLLRGKVQFVMVSDETPEKITAFKNRNTYSFIFLKSRKGLSDYGIYSIPTTYFYDADGNLIEKHRGRLEKESLMELIKK